jgi:putative YphP/YqiW family bacilliredoxin
VRELRTAADVDQAVQSTVTVMIVVNSVCGAAAGKARPGIAMACGTPRSGGRQARVRRCRLDARRAPGITFRAVPGVVAGGGLLRDGQLVCMLEGGTSKIANAYRLPPA